MKNFQTMVIIASILSGVFAYVLNIVLGLDFSAVDASFMPLGVAFILGVVTVASWGGVLGAWLDYQDEN